MAINAILVLIAAFILMAIFAFIVGSGVLAEQSYPRDAQSHRIAPPAKSTFPGSEDEHQLFDLLNQERKRMGLAELSWNHQLVIAANRHAILMAERHVLTHGFPDEMSLQDRVAAAGAHFSRVAENIAYGQDIEEIHNALMHSPGHRANILDPASNEVGISVFVHNHVLWVVEDFAHTVPILTPAQQVEVVAAKLRSMRVVVDSNNHDANKACDAELERSVHYSMTVIHFETSDLSTLPADLARAAKQYGRASVAACTVHEQVNSARGFARYRFAIIFY